MTHTYILNLGEIYLNNPLFIILIQFRIFFTMIPKNIFYPGPSGSLEVLWWGWGVASLLPHVLVAASCHQAISCFGGRLPIQAPSVVIQQSYVYVFGNTGCVWLPQDACSSLSSMGGTLLGSSVWHLAVSFGSHFCATLLSIGLGLLCGISISVSAKCIMSFAFYFIFTARGGGCWCLLAGPL